MNFPWTIQMFGQLAARQADRQITRFRTQKTGLLLAYLALYSDRLHAREEIVERFWPDEELESGRNSLRVALSSLRRQLEPPGSPAGSVLIADRSRLGLNPTALQTDVAEFQLKLAQSERCPTPAEQQALLRSAVELYRGPLLPGYYEDFVATERERLAGVYLGALRRLVRSLAEIRDFETALYYARQALSADPLREEFHRSVMRLLIALGRPIEALGQYDELERVLKEEIGAVPSSATRELAAQLPGFGAPQRDALQSRPDTERTNPRTAPPADETTERKVPFVESTVSELSRLPMQFTRFFGREPEIARLVSLLTARLGGNDVARQPASGTVTDEEAADSHADPSPTIVFSRNSQRGMPRVYGAGATTFRLVTLTGPGGAGKTRLSVEVSWLVQEAYGRRVWFVPLAEISDPRRIIDAILSALDRPPSRTGDSLDQVVAALQGDPALLVLDNFEQLATGGAPVVLALLKRLPALTCLVSSRRRLHLAGEIEMPVGPLPVPEKASCDEEQVGSRGELGVEARLKCPSVALFVERAQAARPDFQITARNANDITALCRQLEGSPLALELAAARAQVLSPAQMLARLSERFELLVSRRMDKTSRHRSVWAAIDWSYDLLSRDLQRFFIALSVFRGGWTFDAAAQICEEAAALDCLAQLRGHSLILTDEENAEPRFRMLETLREYAALKLHDEDRHLLSQRHAHYFLAVAEQTEPDYLNAHERLALDRTEIEHDNLLTALHWFGSAPDGAEPRLRLSSALRYFWIKRGYFREGRSELEQALADDRASVGAPRLRAMHGLASILFFQGGESARTQALAEELLAQSNQMDDTWLQAMAYDLLGSVLMNYGDSERAKPLLEEGLQRYRLCNDRWGIAVALDSLGNLAVRTGDIEGSKRLLSESVSTFREVGERWSGAWPLRSLGEIAVVEQDYERALVYFDESLVMSLELDDKEGIAVSELALGLTALRQGDPQLATARIEKSLALFRELGKTGNAAEAAGHLAGIAFDLGQSRVATDRCLEAIAFGRQTRRVWKTAELLEGWAVDYADRGRCISAARLWGAARALRREGPHKAPERNTADRDGTIKAIRARCVRNAGSGVVTDRTFNAAVAEGETGATDEIIRGVLASDSD